MEYVVDNYTACGLREARPHPVDHPPRTPELGEGAAGMVLTIFNNKTSKAGSRLQENKVMINATKIAKPDEFFCLL